MRETERTVLHIDHQRVDACDVAHAIIRVGRLSDEPLRSVCMMTEKSNVPEFGNPILTFLRLPDIESGKQQADIIVKEDRVVGGDPFHPTYGRTGYFHVELNPQIVVDVDKVNEVLVDFEKYPLTQRLGRFVSSLKDKIIGPGQYVQF